MDPAHIPSPRPALGRAAALRDDRSGAGGAQVGLFDHSPRQLAQRQLLQSAFGARQLTDSEEEEALQGRFMPAQREALADRGAPTLQRQGPEAVMQVRRGSADVLQRAPQAATVIKPGGAGIHKSNAKKVDQGEADELVVRSGGLFRSGIKITVPVGAQVMVDLDRATGDGVYVWVQYTKPDGKVYEGYMARANVDPAAVEPEFGPEPVPELLDAVESESEQEEVQGEHVPMPQPPTQVEKDIALARALLDPYLETHTIGQHMGEEVANRDELIKEAGTKAGEAESWGLRELGVSESLGKASSERQKETLDRQRQREEDLKQLSKKDLVDRLIEEIPEEEPFREAYMDPETSKWDLVKQLARHLGEKDRSEVARLNPQEEVWKRPEFWQYKGEQLLAHPMAPTRGGDDEGKVPIWCDQSTAIIVATLRGNAAFKSSLTVIKQGDPKQHGHWYVLANQEPGKTPAFGDALQGDEFVIDIWGALRLKESDPSVDTVVYQEGTRMLLNTAVVAEPEEGADEEALQDYERTFAAQNKIDTFATFAKR
ncbi:MAG: hypothetical protein KBF65_01250 [Rubrivivax sp.]|nr:hypothetical protein [Betaproteobacteria bacterium]MBP6318716.1 hypothetical protein [Rubrivivax sp.]MBP6463734.1 hypothetical protein [Rubrivivax sp.]MBP9907987.1 hypothetical protein [Rubrivivax sp.]MCU0768046.1 hypothetical protein [Burkholderiaceae bacterium]